MPKNQDILTRTYWEALGRGLTPGETPVRNLTDRMGVAPAADPQDGYCPDGFFQHVIRQGESLITIAQKYNISLTELMSYNPNINPYFYTTGQILCIPASNAPYCPLGTLYAIREGDTFYSIAVLYGVSVDALQSANPDIDPLQLMAGQIICIPSAGTSQNCPPDTVGYTVTASDSLLSLMRAGSFSYGALKEANPDADLLNLTIGMFLCLPVPGSRGTCTCEMGGRAYKMAQDETLTTLAARLGTTEETLVQYNPTLTPGDFEEGQVVCIPADETT